MHGLGHFPYEHTMGDTDYACELQLCKQCGCSAPIIFQDCDGVPVVVVLRAHGRHPLGTGYLQGHTGDRP